MDQCQACGKRFYSMRAEAFHRHNFPVMCTRNKRFAEWVEKTLRKETTP
jgi:hypothetical protein